MAAARTSSSSSTSTPSPVKHPLSSSSSSSTSTAARSIIQKQQHHHQQQQQQNQRRSSRASNNKKKAPLAILPADASNFRAMVQHLTGFPSIAMATDPPPPSSSSPFFFSHFTASASASSALTLPTLDTSASFLLPLSSSSSSSSHHLLSIPPPSPPPPPIPSHFRPIFPLDHLHRPNIFSYDLPSLPSPNPIHNQPFNPSHPLWEAVQGDLPTLHNGGLPPQEGIVTESGVLVDTPRQAAASAQEMQTKHPAVYNSIDSWLALEGGTNGGH